MEAVNAGMVEAITSGIIGGVVAAVAAVATIRVHIAWLRADYGRLERRVEHLEGVRVPAHEAR